MLLGGTPSAMSTQLTERVTGDRAEKKRHHKPMDPDAKRKEHETTQFHRARGQMTYNNLALPLKSKRAPDVDDSQDEEAEAWYTSRRHCGQAQDCWGSGAGRLLMLSNRPQERSKKTSTIQETGAQGVGQERSRILCCCCFLSVSRVTRARGHGQARKVRLCLDLPLRNTGRIQTEFYVTLH
jgi:hypothetical protein